MTTKGAKITTRATATAFVEGLLLGATLEVADEFGEFVEEGYRTEPLAIVNGGVAADRLARGDVVGDAGLGGGDDSVAYGEMAGYADLAGEDDVFADGGGSG